MSDPSGTTEFAATRDGQSQLRRHWSAESPRASLLLVHGIGEHSGRYEHVGAFLASRGVDTLGFDNRGFGQSGGRRAYVESFDEFLDDVEDLLAERRELDVPVILMGHSLGGLISTRYLVSGRTLPDMAVLSSPALAAIVPRWQRIAAPVFSRVAPKLFIPSEIDGDLLTRDEAVQDAYLNDPLVIAGATARLGNEIFVNMKSTSAVLDRIALPTYVLHGDSDRLIPPSASAPLAQLPNVTRVEWEGLRHECLNEPEQEKVLAGIGDWIDSQLGS